MPRLPIILISNLASLCLCAAALPAQQTQAHLPRGHATPAEALTQALAKALPPGATQVAEPVPVELGPLGHAQVVLYRRTADDAFFHGIVLLPAARNSFRALPLPEEAEAAGKYEQITTAILAADIGTPDPGSNLPGTSVIDPPDGISQTRPDRLGQPTSTLRRPPGEDLGSQPAESGQRALVILFYSHEFGHTESTAYGRVYTYEAGRFRIDELRSHLLDGVRTAAVVRLRLAPNQ